MTCDMAPEKDARTILNAYCKNISLSDCQVAGWTHSDGELNAKRTILTSPSGVLQSHHHTASVPHIFSKQQSAQVGDHQSAGYFRSWHNMSIIPDSNTLFTFLGELVTTGVVLLVGCCVTCWSRTEASYALSGCEAEVYSVGSAAVKLLGMQAFLVEWEFAKELLVVCGGTSSALQLANRTGAGRLKHVEVRLLAIRSYGSRLDDCV